MDTNAPISRPSAFLGLVAGILFLGVLIFSLSGSLAVQAAPAWQLTPFPTPTPGADGRILYVVQPGDTLWRIAAITGLTLDELRVLNKLGPDDIINPGDTLLIGLAGPVVNTPTPGLIPEPEEALPTATASSKGTVTLCVILYDDINGDAVRQPEEGWISGGQISLADRAGGVSETEETEPIFDEEGEVAYRCFVDLPPGDYNVTVAIPDGYNPTTLLTRSLTLASGDETYLSFGAQANSERIAETAIIPEAPAKSPLLAIVGGILLLIGVGLGLYAGLLSRLR